MRETRIVGNVGIRPEPTGGQADVEPGGIRFRPTTPRQQEVTRAQVHEKIREANQRARDALNSICTPIDSNNIMSVEEKIDLIRKAYGDRLAWERVLDALP